MLRRCDRRGRRPLRRGLHRARRRAGLTRALAHRRRHAGPRGYGGEVDEIDVAFCFYDDPDYTRDADRDSRILRAWHRRLWSKALPSGDVIEWLVGPAG